MNKNSISVKTLTLSAIFMAMTIVLSTFSITVPGGHLYFCDAAICTGAILIGNPVAAFIMGGFGSFLGDLFFNPPSMFVSLFTHGIQAAVIAFISTRMLAKGKIREDHPHLATVIAQTTGVLIGAVIMVTGYTLGRAFVYATPEYALLKLPFEILQALFGVVVSLVLCAPSSHLRIAAVRQRA